MIPKRQATEETVRTIESDKNNQKPRSQASGDWQCCFCQTSNDFNRINCVACFGEKAKVIMVPRTDVSQPDQSAKENRSSTHEENSTPLQVRADLFSPVQSATDEIEIISEIPPIQEDTDAAPDLFPPVQSATDGQEEIEIISEIACGQEDMNKTPDALYAPDQRVVAATFGELVTRWVGDNRNRHTSSQLVNVIRNSDEVLEAAIGLDIESSRLNYPAAKRMRLAATSSSAARESTIDEVVTAEIAPSSHTGDLPSGYQYRERQVELAIELSRPIYGGKRARFAEQDSRLFQLSNVPARHIGFLSEEHRKHYCEIVPIETIDIN